MGIEAIIHHKEEIYVTDVTQTDTYRSQTGATPKAKASELHVSESELIRDGIEKILRSGVTVPKDISAWEKEKSLSFLIKRGAVKGGRTWQREDIYDRKVSGRH